MMLYKIGEFSKLSNIPAKTLRYYDQINLLSPAQIMPFTGYRMYSAEQLEDAAKIRGLKEMRFTLDEIIMFQGNALLLIEEKEQQLRDNIHLLEKQLHQLETSKKYLLKENLMMFQVNIKKQKEVPVFSKREIFKSRRKVELALETLKNTHAVKTMSGGIINYENTYDQSDLDAEVFVVTERNHANKVLYTKEQLVASVICKECEVEEGYHCLLAYLKENQYQIIGDTIEWRIGEQIELMVPIHKLHERTEHPENDDIRIPFEDDPQVIGHWKVVASEPSLYTKEAFNPDRIKAGQIDGNIQDIYFLPEGEEYWCFAWTKGFLISKFGIEQKGLNPYTIEQIQGKNYMFLQFRDTSSFYYGGKPILIVLEQLDHKWWSKNEIRHKDELSDCYIEDSEVIGTWKVADVVRTLEDFKPDCYNATWCPKDKLFFRELRLEEGGYCWVRYLDKELESPILNWTKGAIQNTVASISEKYIRKIIDGTEYLLVEWKSGDYTYNRELPWYYVFTRVVG